MEIDGERIGIAASSAEGVWMKNDEPTRPIKIVLVHASDIYSKQPSASHFPDFRSHGTSLAPGHTQVKSSGARTNLNGAQLGHQAPSVSRAVGSTAIRRRKLAESRL